MSSYGEDQADAEITEERQARERRTKRGGQRYINRRRMPKSNNRGHKSGAVSRRGRVRNTKLSRIRGTLNAVNAIVREDIKLLLDEGLSIHAQSVTS